MPPRIRRLLAGLALLAGTPAAPGEPDAYLPGPDSSPRPGVPRGDLVRFELSASRIFPGTTRTVTVYVPRQYDPAAPACVFVDQDGVQWNAPVVLDNLIARREIPVQVGVFVTPGVVPAADPAKALPRFDRSFEYDGLGDAYARLLLDEVLPAVEARTAPNGRPIRLSHRGNDRAIAGSSSGAAAAFTAAWEHPEAFSRVLSSIGTYVGLRGADRYPGLIRRYEPKPIRVFLQDGSGDLNIYGGDWWMANQTMERALTFAGYEVAHAWGDGGHTGRQMTALLPDALRWIWKDWPKPVARGASHNGALAALLLPGQDWEVAATGVDGRAALAANGTGEILYTDARTAQTLRVTVAGLVRDTFPKGRPSARQLGADGLFYSADGGALTTLTEDGTATPYGSGPEVGVFVVAHDGTLYAASAGAVRVLRAGRPAAPAASGPALASGIALSPDQSLLYVADGASRWVSCYQVQPGGALAYLQRFDGLVTADADGGSDAAGMCVDRAGWLYVATNLGIQVCDPAGRVEAILPTPSGRPSELCFGGARFDTLYAAAGGILFRRRLNATAANPWDPPALPPAPRL